MRLKCEHATGHAALRCFATQKREHGLVTAVHAVKVANRQGTGRCHARVFEAAKNLHLVDIFSIASGAGLPSL
jgi:hypothetical protein